jgi:hypothetical protein
MGIPKSVKYFNKWFYIQKYYDCFDDDDHEKYIWRFWILGFYFEIK